ncbi:Prolyl oligopeptidase family protein, partial [hydrothermal vent metagenome]
MKKLAAFIFIFYLVFACNVKEASDYIPKTTELTSDIMTPEVLWSFGRVGGAQVSPDGQSVLYTVTYYNIEENKPYRDIYIIPSAGGDAKNITNTPENEFNALWRPDGKQIGYLSSKSGSVQLWEMNP